MGKFFTTIAFLKFDEIRFPLHISKNRGSFVVIYVEIWAQTTRAVLALSCDFVKFPGRNAPDSCASKVFRNKPSQKLGGASALTSTLNESAPRKPSLVKAWKWPSLSRHFNDFSVSKRANPS
ncbi:hypothetical protein HHJ68_02360 [Mobiluncus curtisii]|uniref:Uncharacterized protein n=2 Tax=Mobiluncus curtisii TaxID=2051 RepID=D6ZG58_MOBCV|nr:hypothetical protein HMPREF0573_11297 [Mobiluncus curtisii ATCC 43063]MCU9987667.1 hypothetical protein [Mobiluncus curtisii]MCV0000651.1 hypothetical protein [Mobiluncus curtisii]MCV0021487.1 hypothetical protein [Mobiluncus curtisii]NMW43239.1 hypothetical protein [Mobiluncus curtisii]